MRDERSAFWCALVIRWTAAQVTIADLAAHEWILQQRGAPSARRCWTALPMPAWQGAGQCRSSPSLLLTIAYLAQTMPSPLIRRDGWLLVRLPVYAGFGFCRWRRISASRPLPSDLKRRALSPLAMRLRDRLAALSGMRGGCVRRRALAAGPETR